MLENPIASPIAQTDGGHASTSPRNVTPTNALQQRVSPGILVLASPTRPLHMNQQARELLAPFSGERSGTGRPKPLNGRLPEPLRQVCLEISRCLERRTPVTDWERFEVKCLLAHPDHPILVRGFGIPDATGHDHSRIILLLEDMSGRGEGLILKAKDRFRLTEREHDIVTCLAKGWTNKEIASTLNLALPTIKEHIGHIMAKTDTTTRTGILVRVLAG